MATIVQSACTLRWPAKNEWTCSVAVALLAQSGGRWGRVDREQRSEGGALVMLGPSDHRATSAGTFDSTTTQGNKECYEAAGSIWIFLKS
jgi:hypothetical protein